MAEAPKAALDDEMLALERKLMAAKRLLAIQNARTSLAAFIALRMPDPDYPDDPDKTLYQRTPQGDLLCAVIEDTVAGKRRRTGVSMPPQHGKTMHLSLEGLAWMVGKDPTAPFIMATYNETRAGEIGDELLSAMNSPVYKQVFPGVELHTGSKSKTFMRTTQNGKIALSGLGGTITGRSAKYFIVDDPIKDDEEAQNDNLREKLWNRFYGVVYSRGGNKTSIIVLHTRWHEDDLLGRLCDGEHPERDGRFKGISKNWEYINLPGVVTSPVLAQQLGLKLKRPTSEIVIEQFGDKPMEALWASEKDMKHFAEWRQGDSRSFDALVMGKPAPDEGVYFLDEWLVEYEPHELPPKEELRFYGASDHAVSEKQGRDYTCLGCVGVDKEDNVWVLPTVVWERMETDKTVEELLIQFRVHKPQIWWMENEMISKSFGPFLKQRMMEERTYTTLSPVTPTKDKQTRARSIQGRMSMRKLRFPRSAPWWSRAKAQILRFPYAANDDFVDWLSHIGQGLLRLHGPSEITTEDDNVIQVGSIQWILQSAKRRAEQEQRKSANSGW